MDGEIVRLGVLGLGANWRAWRDVLRRNRRLRVEVVYDQVYQTALREADRLRCQVVESVWQLLSWPGLDAVLYCDEQWFGLWPLEIALAQQGTQNQAAFVQARVSQQGVEASQRRNLVTTWWSLVSPTLELTKAVGILEQVLAADWPVYFLWPEWHVPAARWLCKQARRRLGTLHWVNVQHLSLTSARPVSLSMPHSASALARRFWCGALLWLSELTGELAQEVHPWGNLQDAAMQSRTIAARFPGGGWVCLQDVALINGALADLEPWSKVAVGSEIGPWARLEVRMIGAQGEVLFRWPDTLIWHFRKRQLHERWNRQQVLERRVLRSWLAARDQEFLRQTNRRLKHYCELLLTLRES